MLNFKPLYISFNIGNKHISFGWCYKLETYLDSSGENSVLKTRRNGYQWFSSIAAEQISYISYEEFVKQINEANKND